MSGAPVRVSRVASPREHRAFCALPYALYRGDRHWVPPLRFHERRRWSPHHNASLATRWTERFVARRSGRVVGRVAAIVDDAFAARWAPSAGFVGFLECVHDPAVARALLARAETALAERGVRRVFGPVNLSTHDEVGLMVEGFESAPMFLSPYNPPYYEQLLRDAGYRPYVDYHAFDWDPTREASPAVHRLLRAGDRTAVRIRASDPRHFAEEGQQLLRVYNRSFAQLWGFVPLSPIEYRQRAAEFRRFYRPELAVFADVGDRVVGFGLALPDINAALASVNGRLLPLGWWRLARAIPRIRTARFLLLGVEPEYTGRGIAARLAHAVAAAARQLGIERGELSLVQAGNRQVRHVIEAFGGRPTKTYRLFEKSLETA